MSFEPITVPLKIQTEQEIPAVIQPWRLIPGPPGPPGTDLTYVHTQSTASDEWTVQHNLGKMPSVTVVDSADNIVIGDVTYVDENNLVIKFRGAFSGKAYIN